MSKKKLNHRRIPLDKSSLDPEAIKSDAAKIGLTRAWLLVANALSELQYIPIDQIAPLADTVNRMEVKKADFPRAERITGLEVPTYTIDMKQINSQVDLDKMRRRVEEIGMKAGLRTLCAGLMRLSGASTGITPNPETEPCPCDVQEPLSTIPGSVTSIGQAPRFSQAQIERIFLNIRLTLAEIEAGCNSYREIEDALVKQSVRIMIEG